MATRTSALATIAVVLSMFAVADAAAMAQRTFVASNGSDVNPCSLLLPCRTFGAAITQAIAGGEVIVLDSAGYGPVVITQSVSITAPVGVYAGISVTGGGTGVAITGAGVNVVLRGLTINSTGGSGFAIRMTDGAQLIVDGCAISNFSAGYGVSIETPATVRIAGAVISNNNYGVVAGYGATVNITNSQVVETVFEGILISGGPSGPTTNIFIADTLVTGNGTGSTFCIDNDAVAGASGNISGSRVTITGCQYAVINEPFTDGTLTVSNSMVTGNQYGFYRVNGTFQSLGNNHVSGNATADTSGAITPIGPI
jgi:hypothetical protein